MTMVVRSAGDPAQLAGAARAAIAEVDASQPVFDVATMNSLIAGTLAQRRFTMTLMLLFGLVALVLAAVGIYGVMAYTVTQRTREVGIRMALGARPTAVMAMVLGDGMRLVAAGLVVGVGAALLLGRVVSSLLYGVAATDPVTYAIIAVALAAVAALAIVLPARRAMRVDPMVALRAE
jgi:putative ABC transport system permease protein